MLLNHVETETRNPKPICILTHGHPRMVMVVPVVVVFGMQLYVCASSLVTNCFQSGRFWAKLTVSVCVSLWESRSFWTIFVHFRGRPKCLFQCTSGKGVRICLSHTRTVVRECCKGDDASQWENRKFDPLPRPNPLNDRHKKSHSWLRHGYLPTRKI